MILHKYCYEFIFSLSHSFLYTFLLCMSCSVYTFKKLSKMIKFYYKKKPFTFIIFFYYIHFIYLLRPILCDTYSFSRRPKKINISYLLFLNTIFHYYTPYIFILYSFFIKQTLLHPLLFSTVSNLLLKY